MDSPYKRNKYKKKTTTTNTTITEIQNPTTNKTPKKNKNTKINKKSYLKGGSVLENNQEDDTKFITKARKVVDNVWDSYSLNG